jgi:hypothetical protein
MIRIVGFTAIAFLVAITPAAAIEDVVLANRILNDRGTAT